MPPYEIITAEAVEWARNYDGPLFHALLSDAPYHFTSIAKRFGKPGSAPAQHGSDGAFARASAGFMGQTWDGGDIAFRPETWAAFMPLLHPGAFGMAFASARGWHRLAVAIEDAGYIIHPSIFGWLHGQGFPKGTRIDTQVDRAAGAERERVPNPDSKRQTGQADTATLNNRDPNAYLSLPATDLAKTWGHHRYGLQALKPALEPIIVFQKPYEGRPVDDITRTGARALNIDGGRLEGQPDETRFDPARHHHEGYRMNATGAETFAASRGREGEASADRRYTKAGSTDFAATPGPRGGDAKGRWPPNFALVHAPECEKIGTMRVISGPAPGMSPFAARGQIYGGGKGGPTNLHPIRHTDKDGLETVERWTCVPDCPVAALNAQAGERSSGRLTHAQQEHGGFAGQRGGTIYGTAKQGGESEYEKDTGPASRFYLNADWTDEVHYEPKADRAEREFGFDGIERVMIEWGPWDGEVQKATLLVDTVASPPRVIGVYGTPCNDATVWSMFLFGRGTTDLSLLAMQSTIETATNSTIKSLTLNFLARWLTNDAIRDVNGVPESGGNHAGNAGLRGPSLTITSCGTVSPRGVEHATSRTRLRISASVRVVDHPTIKPLSLLRWLATLLLPPAAYAPRRIFIPFAGAGSEVIAAKQVGWEEVIGVELHEKYAELARIRLAAYIGMM